MAAETPTRLDEYCKLFKKSFFELKLPCLFCKFDLSLQDIAGFYHKELSLVWRDTSCYACCSPCLRLCAKYEKENYTRCIVKGHCIETLLNVPLSNILVRCTYCFKKLDYAEKIDCCINNSPFYLVRHHWRNYCRFCKRET